MDSGGINAAGLAGAVWSAGTRNLTDVGGVIVGEKVQPYSSIIGQSLLAVTNPTIVTYSATKGCLYAIAVNVTTTLTVGSLTATLDITLDGNLFSMPLWPASQFWDPGTQALANFISGNGGTAGDRFNMLLYMGFLTSMTVKLNITASSLGNGIANFFVMWAHP